MVRGYSYDCGLYLFPLSNACICIWVLHNEIDHKFMILVCVFSFRTSLAILMVFTALKKMRSRLLGIWFACVCVVCDDFRNLFRQLTYLSVLFRTCDIWPLPLFLNFIFWTAQLKFDSTLLWPDNVVVLPSCTLLSSFLSVLRLLIASQSMGLWYCCVCAIKL